jgi:heat shock protein HslJ
MRVLYFACIGLLLLVVIMTGCTSQPAQTPAAPATTVTTVQTTTTPGAVPPSLANTVWNLAWFDDTNGMWTKVADGSNVSATFFTEGRVTGSGGCNGFSADYQLGNESRIWIRRPVVPDNLCQAPNGVMSQESAYFTDLSWAETYSITNGQLLIFDKTNRKILQFDPS